MFYSDFTLEKLVKEFHLKLEERTELFPNIQKVAVSDLLLTTLNESVPLATVIDICEN